MSRPSILGRLVGAACVVAGVSGALAQQPAESYPTRPIRIIVGFAPGGSTDGPVRVLAQEASRKLKQPIVVENKPGVGGTLAAQSLLTAAPDGYTLAITSAGLYRLPFTTDAKWNPVADLSYVVGLSGYSFGIVVPASSPIRTMTDLVAQAKAQPGKLTYGTPGVATTNHLTMEQISRQYGIELNHIPYKGSAESLQALLAGQVDSAAETSAFVPFVESGKLRLIAVWGNKRMERFPDVPTLKEQGVDIVQSSPWGLVAPKGTDSAIVSKLHDAFKDAMQTQAFKDVLAKYDMEPDYRSPTAFQAFAAESMRREKVILDALGLSRKP